MKLNWSAWVKLLREDIAYMRSLPPTLERGHVIITLEHLTHEDSGRAFYDALKSPEPQA